MYLSHYSIFRTLQRLPLWLLLGLLTVAEALFDVAEPLFDALHRWTAKPEEPESPPSDSGGDWDYWY